jgi:hypothetical protein
MEYASSRSIVIAAAAGMACSLTPTALADITGFDMLAGWEYNQGDTGTPADFPDPDMIQITNGERQNRSIFFKQRQDVSQFSASFTFRADYQGGNNPHGITFAIHNDLDGAEALGSLGGGLGYEGITSSGALGLEVLRSQTGWFEGGVVGGMVPITDFVLGDDHDIRVTLDYDGTFIRQRMVDTVTGAEFSRNYVADDLLDELGGSMAYVGFTAGTSGFGHSDQFISDFRFRTVPTPGAAALLALAGLGAGVRRRR